MATLKPGQKNTIELHHGTITLQFGTDSDSLTIARLAQWQHVFQSKQPDLTTGVYVYDPALFDPDNPSSRARKLLGQDEVVTLGSIRNTLYFGEETDVSYLDPEHVRLTLVGKKVEILNVGKTPFTIDHSVNEQQVETNTVQENNGNKAIRIPFGYFPDYREKNSILDWYLRVIGYPFGSRRNEVRLVLDEVDARPRQKILDVGCGDGIWTNYLAANSKADVHGLDISEHDLQVAKIRAEKTNTKVAYHLQDAAQMDFEDDTFDTIFSISTLEHTDDDQAILNEMFRVLKPGGKIVISVPRKIALPIVHFWLLFPKKARFFLNSSLQQASSVEEYVAHVNTKFAHQRLYNLKKIQRKLSQAGLKYQKHRYHISFFGLLPHSIVHTLKVFEWSKTKTSSYSFFNQVVFAISFPFLYPWYLLDNLLPDKKGFVIIAVATKPTTKSRTRSQTRNKDE